MNSNEDELQGGVEENYTARTYLYVSVIANRFDFMHMQEFM